MSGAVAPRLLLDQNLAAGLVRRIADIYPGSAHVRDVGLVTADDEAIWQFAATHGFAIVTKDDDFRQRSMLRGAPPQSCGYGWETVGPPKLRPCSVEGLQISAISWWTRLERS